MPAHDVLDDGETESGASGFARPGLVDPIKTFRQPRQMLGLDAGSVVFDAQLQAVAPCRPADTDLGTFGGVLDRVEDEIGEGAAQLGRAPEQEQILVDVGREGVPAVAQRMGLLQDQMQLVRDIDRLLHLRVLVHLQARECQQVFDNEAHPLGLIVHQAQRTTMIRRRGRSVDQALEEAGDHGQGRAQLMRGIGDEVAPDHVQMIDLGDVACDHEALALALAERGDAQRQHQGAVVFRGEIHRSQGLTGLDEVLEIRMGQDPEQRPPVVLGPVHVHQGRRGGVRPIHPMQFVEDHQAVRHRIGRLAKATGKADLTLAALAPALLILRDAAIDLAPEPARKGGDQPVVTPNQQRETREQVEVAQQIGNEDGRPGPSPFGRDQPRHGAQHDRGRE